MYQSDTNFTIHQQYQLQIGKKIQILPNMLKGFKTLRFTSVSKINHAYDFYS